MFCCELEPQVENLAGKLKQAALQEARQKNIISNIYYLINCVNPYVVNDIVIVNEATIWKVFRCGELVFHWQDYDLKRYIRGDWTSVLDKETSAMRARRRQVEHKDRMQTFRNSIAAQNYI